MACRSGSIAQRLGSPPSQCVASTTAAGSSTARRRLSAYQPNSRSWTSGTGIAPG